MGALQISSILATRRRLNEVAADGKSARLRWVLQTGRQQQHGFHVLLVLHLFLMLTELALLLLNQLGDACFTEALVAVHLFNDLLSFLTAKFFEVF